jgi:hypothetical protein
MIDFMSVLYSVLAGDIFELYSLDSSKGAYMNFYRFLDFCRDHSIFPTQCSKAVLTKIFNSLAFTKQKRSSSVNTTRNVSLSTSCYIDIEKDQS